LRPAFSWSLRAIVLALSAAQLLASTPASAIAPYTAPSQKHVVGTSPSDVICVDLNRDAARDLVAANVDANTISVLVGNGDGTFQQRVDYATGSGPLGIARVDLNGDSKPDLLAANSTGHSISVLLGRGDGTFDPKADFTAGPTGASPRALVTGRLDGDAYPDVLTLNDDGTYSFLAGTGTGSVLLGVDHAVPGAGANNIPIAITAADFNHDGRMDLAITLRSATQQGQVRILLGVGDGTFATGPLLPTGRGPHGIATGDVDGDGNVDLATADSTVDSVSVLHGHGDGGFDPYVNEFTGSGPVAVAIGDFDHDGRADLVTADSQAGGLSVLLASGPPAVSHRTGGGPFALAVADLDDDGDLDLVAANRAESRVATIVGWGGGRFSELLESPAGPAVAAVGDLNGDGRLDIAALDSQVEILAQNADGTFAAPTPRSVLANPTDLVLADLNHDNRLDVLVSNQDSNKLSVFLANAGGGFDARVDASTSSQPRSIAVADFNHDGNPDVAVACAGSNEVAIHFGTGNGSLGGANGFSVPTHATGLAAADLNGDGVPDLVVTGQTVQTIGVLINGGNGSSFTRSDYASGDFPYAVAIGDVTGDGRKDLVVANTNSNTISVYANQSGGAFAGKVDYATGVAPEGVCVTDVDDDGRADVVVSNTSSRSLSIFRSNSTGTFEPRVDVPVGENPLKFATADLDIDGLPDLVVPCTYENRISILRGRGTLSSLPPGGGPLPSPGDMTAPLTVSDGATGTIVAWQASIAGGDFDVYAQHVTSAGLPAPNWPSAGVGLCTHGGNQYPRSMASDGEGGAIVAWVDERDSLANGGNVYVQRVGWNGAVRWTADGLAVQPNAAGQIEIALAPDGLHGCIATWVDARLPNLVLFAQHIDSSGVARWPFGTRVAARASWQREPAITTDDANGAFVAWTDSLSGSPEVRVQHLGADGSALFGADGLALSDPVSGGDHPTIISNALVVWHGHSGGSLLRGGATHASSVGDAIYARRIDASGLVWASNVAVCDGPPGSREHPTIISDMANGAIVAWSDSRDGGEDLYAQRLTSSGNVAWTPNGVPVSRAAGDQTRPQLASDGASGAFIIWQDGRGADLDVYAQRLVQDGTRPAAWPVDGVAVCAASGDQQDIVVVPDGKGGIMAAWQDGRADTTKIFTTRVGADAETPLAVTGPVPPRDPGILRLVAVHPNPSWGVATIDLVLDHSAVVDADVYDLGGRRVAQLAAGMRYVAGSHAVPWDGRDARGSRLPAGIYFVRLSAAGQVMCRTVVRLR